MIKYILKRLSIMLIMILLISTMIFFLFRTMPGDPTAFIVDPSMPKEAREITMERYGLNGSKWDQYQIFVKDLVRLDLGNSFFYGRPVIDVIKERVPATLILMITAMIIAYVIGITMGAMMAWKRGSLFESVGTAVTLVFRSAPTFWVALMAILLFATNLKWLPAQGMRTTGYTGETFSEIFLNLDFLKHLILPAFVSGLYFVATPLLTMRNSMLEVLSEDYIEMARAKGLSERRILFKHAARNALLPVVTAGAVFIGAALGGLVLIEVVFSWPGLGREIVQAVSRYDYPLAQGAFIILSSIMMFMNLVADILYGLLDPRITYK